MAPRPLDRLPDWARRLLEQERVARLGLLDEDDSPRVLPVTFVLAAGAAWSAIDDKPKRSGREPARIRFLRSRPAAALTADHYADDWSRLAWVQLLGSVAVLDEGDAGAGLDALCAKYPQYAERPPPGPFLRLDPDRALWWSASEPG